MASGAGFEAQMHEAGEHRGFWGLYSLVERRWLPVIFKTRAEAEESAKRLQNSRMQKLIK